MGERISSSKSQARQEREREKRNVRSKREILKKYKSVREDNL